MKYQFAFISLCLIHFHTSADPNLEAEFLRHLSQAKDPQTVEKLNQNYKQIRIVRIACDLQMHQQMVPSACYEVLALEKHLRLSGNTTLNIRRLDRLCEIAAERHAYAADLTPALSAPCAQAVRQARTIRDYLAEDRATWSAN